MTSEKALVRSVGQTSRHTAIGGRRFRRRRGQFVRYAALPVIIARDLEWHFSKGHGAECVAGVLMF